MKYKFTEQEWEQIVADAFSPDAPEPCFSAQYLEKRKSLERRIAMTNYDKFIEEQMKDPAFRKEWEALQPEMAIVKAMIGAREAGKKSDGWRVWQQRPQS